MKLNRTTVKIAAFVMCMAMVVPMFAGCDLFKEIDKNYTGPEFFTTLSDAPSNFDPMYAYLDDSASQLLSFIYEGLFRYDENGKPVKALCDSYEWVKKDAETGEYIAEFTIKDSAWSDTQPVTADHFVFAWRRILNPGNHSEAASLLYDIKNARNIKTGTGDFEVFDLGATAVGSNIIRIEFEREVNLDEFIANLASPCLVPLRNDAADKIDNWASTPAIVVANGPFYLKTFKPDESIVFERNRYYLRDVEEDEMYEYVTPYRVTVYLGNEYKTVAEDGSETRKSFENLYELSNFLYTEGELSYYSNLGTYAETYASNGDFTKVDRNNTHTYIFNTSNKLFADARVRKALSLALDRDAMIKAAAVVGEPAKGIVTSGAFETGYAKKKAETFRSKGGDLIGSVNVEEAKKLLKEANVTGGNFSITVRRWDPVAVAAATYAAEAWKALGFNVSVTKLDMRQYNDEVNAYDGLYRDSFIEAYNAGNFDVIAVDLVQMTNTAFSALAPYATGFSGGSIDLTQQQDEYTVTHKSGYASAEYDALIEAAFAETDAAKKAEILHQAEAMLMNDMPVIPLFTFSNLYTVSSNVKGIEHDWYGAPLFIEANDKNYEYVPEKKG